MSSDYNKSSNTTSSNGQNNNVGSTSFSSYTKHKSANTTLLVFFIIAVILIVINFVRFANGSADVSFAGFLSYIKDAPRLIPFISIQDFTILDDWGIFNGLRSFLNIFTSLFGVIVWFGSSALNFLGYVSYFITYLFV